MALNDRRRFEFVWDAGALAAAFGVTREDVREYLTDGRRASFMVERRLKALLGWQLAPSEGAAFDLRDRQGGLWEVRSITESGVYFTPSNQVGSGRSFDKAAYMRKLGALSGFILTDIVDFPTVRCFRIDVDMVLRWQKAGRLGTSARVSRTRFLTDLAKDVS
ncbi:MAG: hypothetical protein IT556_10290 [Acetobacteraceae bacterium]|nr:hypothetical protein [Acetobacteraceae bacterium]